MGKELVGQLSATHEMPSFLGMKSLAQNCMSLFLMHPVKTAGSQPCL